MKSDKQLNILFCIEQDILETQACLFVKSCQHNLDKDSASLHAFSPRENNQPDNETKQFLIQHDVHHHAKYLNQEFLDYPIANKLLACADFEKNNPQATRILFVDTDTIFLNPINPELMTDKPTLYVRPVDNKGPGSESKEDKNDTFWKQVFKLFNLPIPDPSLTTTVRPSTIRPYYNAGFIWVNNIPGFYQQWLQDFLTIVKSELRPFGYQSRDGDDFRCLDQVALAVTASRFQKYIKILPETYNYPLPFRPYMKDRDNHPAFKDLVHIHYHKWFQHPGFLDHVTSEEDRQTAQYRWLKEQLPLHPTIDGPFKC